MPKSSFSGRTGFELVSTMRKAQAELEPETPFRILVMGDFSGSGRKGTEKGALARRRIYRVDRENLDEIMGKLGVEVWLPLNGRDNPPVPISLGNLDGFHPDSLFERLETFQSIKEHRKKLGDPSFFAEAEAPEKEKETPTATERAGLSAEQLLQQKIPDETGLFESLLQKSPHDRPGRDLSFGTSEVDRFLKGIVKPHVDLHAAERRSLLEKVDQTAGALMRAILHYPDFQEIEAAWRGLDFFLSNIETCEDLKVYLLDISKAELSAGLGSGADPAESPLYRLIVEPTAGTLGAEPWAVVAGNFTFEDDAQDLELLGRMSGIAAAAGAPFIAAAGAGLLRSVSPSPGERTDAETENEAWRALRRLPQASWIGLALPAFLLRLPYGVKTEAIDSFGFEELKDPPELDRYLWGNPCFFCACLLAQTFTEESWDMRPGTVQELSGLPLHTYKNEEGETRSTPCARVLLGHSAAEAILGNGIMPLLSYRDEGRVRLARFQSIADPPGPLYGRWG